jgi:Fe-S-cluster containining protein
MRLMNIPTTTYKCDQCGLCCQAFIVEASHIDVVREPLIAEKCKRMDGKGDLKNPADWCWSICVGDTEPCPFLKRSGKTSCRWRCKIYPTRPNECVSFQAGSRRCQGLREKAGLPLLTPVTVENDHDICCELFRDDGGDDAVLPGSG